MLLNLQLMNMLFELLYCKIRTLVLKTSEQISVKCEPSRPKLLDVFSFKEILLCSMLENIACNCSLNDHSEAFNQNKAWLVCVCVFCVCVRFLWNICLEVDCGTGPSQRWYFCASWLKLFSFAGAAKNYFWGGVFDKGGFRYLLLLARECVYVCVRAFWVWVCVFQQEREREALRRAVPAKWKV